MNIAQAIMYLYPDVDPMRDFIVRDNGAEPVLLAGAEEKGRVRYEIKQPELGEEPVEGIHYRYGIDYNLLTEGEDYDLVERGQFIAAWNLDVPQPTEQELLVAWEELQALPEPTPQLTDVELLQKENQLLKAQNSALSERADFIEDIIAEMAMMVYV